jgi:hypothetical protein
MAFVMRIRGLVGYPLILFICDSLFLLEYLTVVLQSTEIDRKYVQLQIRVLCFAPFVHHVLFDDVSVAGYAVIAVFSVDV